MKSWWKWGLGILIGIGILRSGAVMALASLKFVLPIAIGYFAYLKMKKLLGIGSKPGSLFPPGDPRADAIDICPDCGEATNIGKSHRCAR